MSLLDSEAPSVEERDSAEVVRLLARACMLVGGLGLVDSAFILLPVLGDFPVEQWSYAFLEDGPGFMRPLLVLATPVLALACLAAGFGLRDRNTWARPLGFACSIGLLILPLDELAAMAPLVLDALTALSSSTSSFQWLNLQSVLEMTVLSILTIPWRAALSVWLLVFLTLPEVTRYTRAFATDRHWRFRFPWPAWLRWPALMERTGLPEEAVATAALLMLFSWIGLVSSTLGVGFLFRNLTVSFNFPSGTYVPEGYEVHMQASQTLSFGFAILLLPLAVLGVVAAFGMVRAKPWARTCALVFAWLLVVRELGQIALVHALYVLYPVDWPGPRATFTWLGRSGHEFMSHHAMSLIAPVLLLLTLRLASVRRVWERIRKQGPDDASPSV